jgi:23S rRNA (adenine2503-C2)-methyltransferase
MKNLYDLTLVELEDFFLSIDDKKYRAKQVYEWLYKKKINKIEEMSNINKETLDIIKKSFLFDNIKIIKKEKSDNVIKYLFELFDNQKIEAVVMFHDYGNSLCISTQVGCNMNCSFCESGRLKKIRNLEIYEMVLQILSIEADIKSRISHVVLMGIGEPFDNYDNVIKFIRIINDPFGMAIGARHITISTCGIVDKIKMFMNENLQVNLAISLHAPNDELRNKLMPINKIYNINSLIDSIKEYILSTNRRLTFEYIMIDGVNDTEPLALELAKLLRGINCYVNLIPYNETSYIEYKRSSNDKILKFYDILKKEGINVTIRREFGSLVTAACGQLRSSN